VSSSQIAQLLQLAPALAGSSRPSQPRLGRTVITSTLVQKSSPALPAKKPGLLQVQQGSHWQQQVAAYENQVARAKAQWQQRLSTLQTLAKGGNKQARALLEPGLRDYADWCKEVDANEKKMRMNLGLSPSLRISAKQRGKKPVARGHLVARPQRPQPHSHKQPLGAKLGKTFVAADSSASAKAAEVVQEKDRQRLSMQEASDVSRTTELRRQLALREARDTAREHALAQRESFNSQREQRDAMEEGALQHQQAVLWSENIALQQRASQIQAFQQMQARAQEQIMAQANAVQAAQAQVTSAKSGQQARNLLHIAHGETANDAQKFRFEMGSSIHESKVGPHLKIAPTYQRHKIRESKVGPQLAVGPASSSLLLQAGTRTGSETMPAQAPPKALEAANGDFPPPPTMQLQ